MPTAAAAAAPASFEFRLSTVVWGCFFHRDIARIPGYGFVFDAEMRELRLGAR